VRGTDAVIKHEHVPFGLGLLPLRQLGFGPLQSVVGGWAGVRGTVGGSASSTGRVS
jgi:hypothetical protein